MAYTFIRRYLAGYELEYDEDIVEEMKGYAYKKNADPFEYLVVAETHFSPDLKFDDSHSIINHNIYEPIEGDGPFPS